jgi:hypothetical protein
MISCTGPPLARKKREDHQLSDHCEHGSNSPKLQEHQDQDCDQHEMHGRTVVLSLDAAETLLGGCPKGRCGGLSAIILRPLVFTPHARD